MNDNIKVLCTGVFNILHSDHVRQFEFASSLGQVWIGLNGARYNVLKNKESAIPLEDRIYMLRSCKWVSKVVVFDEDTPIELIRVLKPRYYVKGPDYKDMDLPEKQACLDVGAEMIFRPGAAKYHSSHFSIR